MNADFRKRLLRTAILSGLALVVGAGIALVQIKTQTASVVYKQAQNTGTVPGLQITGNFALTDQNGVKVTQDNFAGKYKLIYFGFTYCPAVCPTELQKITKTITLLGAQGEQIQPLFITIDPERDTVPVMKDYVGLFTPRLVGLTGTPAEISATLKTFRIYAKKVKTEEMSDYTMDHSSFIYLLNTRNELVALYRTEDNAEYIAQDLRTKLSAS